MLRELDFIESDWAALFWALGSSTAILRHAVPRGLRAWLGKYSRREEKEMNNNIGKKAVGVMWGVGIAVAVFAASGFGLLGLSYLLFPQWDAEKVRWAQWLLVILIPEVVFISTAVAVWRKRRSMAVGILLSAAILIVHFIVHITTHG